MKKAIKTRWVKALRSGKYLQGFERLIIYDGKEQRYCCLGVLCKINPKMPDSKMRLLHDDDDLSSSQLEYLGLSTEEERAVMNLNDFEKRTFQDIADYIEVNF